jgi:Ca2+-binding RTX toxin-like protein
MIGTVTRSDESNVSYDAKDILVFSGTIDGVEKTLVVDSKGIESNSDYYTNDRMDTTVGFREFEVSGSAEPGVEVEITDDAGQVVGSVVADASGQWATRLSADASSEGELTATATDVEGNVTTDTTQYQVGTKGVDTLQGDGADDSLEGGSGNDTLLGGSGDDLLIGGLGADVFSWELGDQGSESAPAEDVVQDFSEGTYTGTGEADQLDLADLLQGETEENIADYLSVTEESDDLVFQVSHSGTSGGETQTIRLEGKSFSDFGVDSGEGLIQQMIDNGQLNIDS